MLFSELKCKDVINIKDCRKLGRVCDLEFDPCSGCICKIMVPVFNEVYYVDDTHCQFNSVELLCESRLMELINYKKSSLLVCFNSMVSCDFCTNFYNCKLKAKLDKSGIVSGILKTINNNKKVI